METQAETRVDQVSLEQQIETAQQVADWFMPYMYGVDVELQELPLIVRARMSEVVGTYEYATQLRFTKEAFAALPPEHKSNALLYLAGYPQAALSALADGDITETVALLAEAGEAFRPQQVPRRRVGRVVPPQPRRPREDTVPQDWFVDPARREAPRLRRPVDDDAEDALAWQSDALCAQVDPEAFFPEKGGSTRDAKRICTQCDVKEQCLNYALEHDERFGIWGGLSERERRRLRRAKRA